MHAEKYKTQEKLYLLMKLVRIKSRMCKEITQSYR